ncbi:GyrI-like domain-containing protein [Lacisediminihabitans profunda]|uniref:GyrI-like domain-containing protein n=1 Tax=Lacisediminihabitans profunda TaxID=2594790 RepID=A0A5C8USB5_9MICO|nr:GyrI-like domain-containing protein [Lacisediminihabitans profunda]TXN31474.1 GyrI-like domain-containing protein [Lacisediminihabitans profunda]
MNYQVESRTLEEQPTAVISARLPFADVPQWLPEAFQEVVEALARQGVRPGGMPFARYVFHPDAIGLEAGLPVQRPVTPDGRVVPGSLPGGAAAVTTHVGPYEDLEAAVGALREWIIAQGGEPAGGHWEIYHSDSAVEPDPRTWRTEVVLPWRAKTPPGAPTGGSPRETR